MNKLFITTVLLMASLAGTALAQDNGDSAKIAALQAKVEALDKRIATLEAQLSNITLTSSPTQTAKPQTNETKPIQATVSPLVLDDWSFQYKEDDVEKYYTISLTLHNTGTKPKKLVDASVEFSDLLDAHIYGIKVSPDLTIGPGETYMDSGSYHINTFIGDQMRMKDMKKADIKVHLDVNKIVFSDNTVLTVNPVGQ